MVGLQPNCHWLMSHENSRILIKKDVNHHWPHYFKSSKFENKVSLSNTSVFGACVLQIMVGLRLCPTVIKMSIFGACVLQIMVGLWLCPTVIDYCLMKFPIFSSRMMWIIIHPIPFPHPNFKTVNPLNLSDWLWSSSLEFRLEIKNQIS